MSVGFFSGRGTTSDGLKPILSGECCEICGDYIAEPTGYASKCSACQVEVNQDRAKRLSEGVSHGYHL